MTGAQDMVGMGHAEAGVVQADHPARHCGPARARRSMSAPSMSPSVATMSATSGAISAPLQRAGSAR